MLEYSTWNRSKAKVSNHSISHNTGKHPNVVLFSDSPVAGGEEIQSLPNKPNGKKKICKSFSKHLRI
jgi:hypothetical protein